MTQIGGFRTVFTTGLLVVGLIMLLILQWHNVSLYPPTKGFDAEGHIDYIKYLQTNHKIPLAHEGWELYQPPLYYLFAMTVSNLKSIQFIGLLLWVGMMLISGLFIGHYFKSVFYGLWAAGLTGSIPVLIYQTPGISNELMNTMMITGLLVLTLLLSKWPNSRLRWFIWVLWSSAAILTKATAILAVGISAIYLWRQLTMNRKVIITAISMISLLGGWFYGRNIMVYGSPLVTSVDFPKYRINQEIIPRSLSWWVNLEPFFKMDLFKAHWSSGVAGTFMSFFYDGHNNLIPVQEKSLAGDVLILAAIIIFFVSLCGLYFGLKKRDQNTIFTACYAVLLLASYVLYNYKLPFYSTVKGVFIGSLIFPIVYWIVTVVRKYEKYQIFFVGGYLMWILLVVKNFWILEGWYR